MANHYKQESFIYNALPDCIISVSDLTDRCRCAEKNEKHWE